MSRKRVRMNEEGVWGTPISSLRGVFAPARKTVRTYMPRRGTKSGNQSVSGNLARDNSKKTKVVGVSPQLKRAVRAILDSQAEYKFFRSGSNFQARGTIASTDIIDYSPAITQGTTQSTRVGNDIKIKSFSFDILISAIPSATIMPFVLRILILKPKNAGTLANNSPTTLAADFYETGGGSAPGDGGWSNQVTVPNLDLFDTLYDRVTPVLQWQTAIPTAASAVTNTKIIMNQLRYSIDVPYMRGVLKYDDANSTASKVCYMVVQAINTNNSGTQNAGATVCADVYVATQVCFTDV